MRRRARERRRPTFYDALGFELRRVSRQYDGSLAQLQKRKVASLLGERRKGSVLDLLRLGADEELWKAPRLPRNPPRAVPTSPTLPTQVAAPAAHRPRVPSCLPRGDPRPGHHTNLNYTTAFARSSRSSLKKTCQAIAAERRRNGDDALPRRTHRASRHHSHHQPSPPRAQRAGDGRGRGPAHGVGRPAADPTASMRLRRRSPARARPSSHAAPSSVGAHHRRARSHGPLPASPNRNVYKATAAAAEVRNSRSPARASVHRERGTRESGGGSRRAYTRALCLTHENHGEDVVRVARRRLRLIERPAPPAAELEAPAGVSAVRGCATSR